MKSERRHELQHNVLADQLGKWMRQVAPYMKIVAWCALGAAVVLFSLAIWSYYQNRQSAAAWKEYMEALASADQRASLQDLAASKPNDTVGIWARLSLADSALAAASQLVYRNREEAERDIAEAREDYEQVLDSSPRSVLVKQRARYGIAQSYEVLGELKNARTNYEKVVELGEDTALGKEAQAQIQLLKDKDIRGFYDWFVAQRDVPRPPAGFGLDNLNNLPDSPNFDIEGLLNRTNPGGSTPSDQPSTRSESEFDSSILNETLTEPGDDVVPESTGDDIQGEGAATEEGAESSDGETPAVDADGDADTDTDAEAEADANAKTPPEGTEALPDETDPPPQP